MKNLESNDTVEPKDTIKFLEMLNNHLADEIQFLRDHIVDLTNMNKALMNKINPKSPNTPVLNEESFEPIKGYNSLKNRIEEAELESKIKAEEESNAGEE